MKVTALLIAVLLLAGCSHQPPAYESRYTEPSGTELVGAATPPEGFPDPPPIALPRNARAVFIGDSWTQGYSATPEANGFAYLTEKAMGWTGPVLGAAGTGYTRDKNGVPPYPARIGALPTDPEAQIVILQGGINDRQPGKGVKVSTAADQVITAVRAKFPQAALVMVGPCTTTGNPDTRTEGVDEQLQAAARRNIVHYVSCYQRDWINPSNVATVMDPETGHPSTAGHAYLAERLTAALREITQS